MSETVEASVLRKIFSDELRYQNEQIQMWRGKSKILAADAASKADVVFQLAHEIYINTGAKVLEGMKYD